jgi:hypothetical protein
MWNFKFSRPWQRCLFTVRDSVRFAGCISSLPRNLLPVFGVECYECCKSVGGLISPSHWAYGTVIPGSRIPEYSAMQKEAQEAEVQVQVQAEVQVHCRKMRWLGFRSWAVYSNENFPTFRQVLQLPSSELVNSGVSGSLRQIWLQVVTDDGQIGYNSTYRSLPDACEGPPQKIQVYSR